MKTFISAADIEEMADQGVRELTVDEDTVLTAVARETAAQRGVKLVAPGAANKTGFSGASEAGAKPGLPGPTVVSGKPRGCQHGPLGAGTGSPATGAKANAGPVVDELIGAVKQLARTPHGA